MNIDKELDEILEDMFMIGVEHEKRLLPEIDRLQDEAKSALKKLIIEELRNLITFTDDGVQMLVPATKIADRILSLKEGKDI